MSDQNTALLLVLEEAGSFHYLEPCLSSVERPLYCFVSKLLSDRVSRYPQLKVLPTPSTKSEFLNQMKKYEISDVLMTTGWSDGLCRQIFRFLEELKFPYAALVDHWSWFKERFSEISEGTNTCGMEFHPRELFVIDDLARRRALEAGFLAEKVSLLGHPVLEAAYNGASKYGEGSPEVIGFVSEEYSSADEKVSMPYQFDQYSVLKDLVELVGPTGRKLIIRPHPQENKEALLAIQRTSSDIAEMSPERKEDFLDRCGLIVGMQSMLLIEAALSGKPVISYQPGLRGTDIFVGNMIGLTRACYSHDELREALWAPFEAKLNLSENPFEGSKKRIVELLSNFRLGRG